MNENNFVKVQGFIRLQVKDKNGVVIHDTGFGKNVITNAGLAAIAGLVGNTGSITAFSYLAVGTSGSGPTDATKTTLVAEITDTGLERASATVSRSTTNQTNDTLQFDKVWTATGSKSILEVGVFNASSSGTMLARKVITQVDVVNTNTLTATYKIIFT